MARNSPINVKDKGSKREVSSESRNSGKKKMKWNKIKNFIN